MSQCRAGKRRIALSFKRGIIFLLFAGLGGCDVAELERFARENESLEADQPGHVPATGLQSRLLVPAYIINGGKREFKGVAGQFARMLVGEGDEIRLSRPVAVGGVGEFLYIVDAAARVVFRYNLKTKAMDPIGEVGVQFVGEPGNIFVASDMSFYIVDSDGKQVFHFSETGELLDTYSDAANLSRPLDVLVNEADQEILVADGSYSHIVVFNKFGRTLRAIGRRGPQNSRLPGTFRAITDTTMGKDGLYVLDRLVLPVQVLSPQGQFQYSFGESQQIFPTAIAVSEDQYVFVSDKSDNTIRVYKQGALLAVVGGGGSGPGRFRIITGLWAHKGYLYVADSLNRRVQVMRIVGEAPIEADAPNS